MSNAAKHKSTVKARLSKAAARFPLERVLLGLAVLATVLLVGKFVWFRQQHDAVTHVVEGYEQTLKKTATTQPSGSGSAKPQAAPGGPGAPVVPPNPRVAARLQHIADRKLFAPPPSIQLTGIMGDEAFFNGGQSVKVGGSIQNAKVTKINAASVEMTVDGQPTTMYVFGPSADAAPAPGVPGGPGMARRGSTLRTVTPEMIAQFKQMPPAQRETILKRMDERDPDAARKIRASL